MGSMNMGSTKSFDIAPRRAAAIALVLAPALAIAALLVAPRAYRPDAGVVAGKVIEAATRDAAVTSDAPWPVPLDRRSVETPPSSLPRQPATVVVDDVDIRVAPSAPQRVVRRATASPYADPHAAHVQVGPGSISR